jgi:hypothetical protein
MGRSGGGLEQTNFSSFALIIKHDLENESPEIPWLR